VRSVDRVVATLYHEEPDKVPLVEGFAQPEARDRFFTQHQKGKLDLLGSCSSELERKIKEARWWGNDIISVWINAPNLLSKVIVHDPGRRGYTIVKEAWGSITYTRRIPGFHIVLHSPIRYPEDLDRIEVPSLDEYEQKITEISKKIKTYKEAGFFVEAFHNGPFVMTWHRLRGLTAFLKDIVRDPAFAKKLVDFAMSRQLELTKAIIDEAKPDAIRLGNDMGTTQSLFFSPKAYKEIFNPWEKRLVQEYHKKGVFVFHHCHGNINLILKDMVETGIDAIDPLDPHDGINLAEVKEKYGDKITLRGGMSKYIGTYNRNQIYEHVSDRIRTAAPGGGYIISSSAGLPTEMPKENVLFYRETVNNLRKYNILKN